jgi:hypothetical protein
MTFYKPSSYYDYPTYKIEDVISFYEKNYKLFYCPPLESQIDVIMFNGYCVGCNTKFTDKTYVWCNINFYTDDIKVFNAYCSNTCCVAHRI